MNLLDDGMDRICRVDRWRLGLAEGESKYDELESQLAELAGESYSASFAVKREQNAA